MIRFFGLIILLICFAGCEGGGEIGYQGQKGSSLHFDGVDDQIILPHHEKLNINSGSIEVWFQLDHIDSITPETYKEERTWNSIVSKELAYQITLKNNRIATYNWKTKEVFVFGDTLQPHRWYHAALTFQDGVEKGSRLYLDGNLMGEPFKIDIVNQGSQLFIGGNHFTDQYFSGCIDDVRIWNRVLEADEIKKNYQSEIYPDEAGLVLYYKFNTTPILKNNHADRVVYDATVNELNGDYDGFTFDSNKSNYIRNSPLNSTRDFYVTIFLKKHFWEILILVLGIIMLIILLKLNTRILKRRNVKLQKLVDFKTRQLQKNIQQKEVLIQEIHHRVKNNLQFIISLIEFELNQAKINLESGKLLENISRRLHSIALVHEMLYRKDDLESVSSKEYLTELVNTVRSIAEDRLIPIQYKLEIDDYPLNVNQCTSLGIITSELFTNSYKHAFHEMAHPEIYISFKVDLEKNGIIFQVGDNGKGFPEGMQQNAFGVGGKLIDIFVRQMGAHYKYENSHGLNFKMEIPMMQK